MVFSSVIFLFFYLPAVLIVYYLVPKIFKNTFLIIVSLFFYWWGEHAFVWVMIGSICANYTFGCIIDHYREREAARIILAVAVFLNLSLLGYFKYADFIVSNLSVVWGKIGGTPLSSPGVHLPIGISFFTFQAISYVIDIYRKSEGPIKRLDATALFISLFPQLIAGPIIRYHDVQDQLRSRSHSLDNFSLGIQRFVIGLGKKILIANTLATAADAIFTLPASSLFPALAWIGICCYTLQIYHDFSGYSDMAIGLGHMLGFSFMENFNYPYIAVSIRDFWRRWHISLSSWFRDYLYLPLGGNRKGTIRTGFNLLTVFFLCGFWHGASWNFIYWGLFHGLFLVIERAFPTPPWKGWFGIVRHGYVLVVVMVGWVFFRTATLGDAGLYFKAMVGMNVLNGAVFPVQIYVNNETILAMVCGAVGATPLVASVRRWIQGGRGLDFEDKRKRPNAVWHLQETTVLMLILLGCAMKLAVGTYNPFIYFRF